MNEKNLIFTKLINVSRKVKPISKDQTNDKQGFKFRGVDDLFNALQPLMSEEGIFVTSEIINSAREERKTKSGTALIYSIIDMKFSFYAEDGSEVHCITKGEGMDSGDKASNKAMAMALKYALLQMFMIPTQENIDTDQTSHTVIPEEKKQIKKVKGDIVAAKSILSTQRNTMDLAAEYSLLGKYEWTSIETQQIKLLYQDYKQRFLDEMKGA